MNNKQPSPSLASGKFAKSFADAILVKPLAAGPATLGGLAFEVTAPAGSADVALDPVIDLAPGPWSHIAVLYVLDNFPEKRPALTLGIEATQPDGSVLRFEERFDERQRAYASLPEVARILRGPSGTLSFPFRVARIPLKPEAVRALASAVSAKASFHDPRSSVAIFGIATVPCDPASPPPYVEPEVIVDPEPDARVARDGFTLRLRVDLAGVAGGEKLYDVPGTLSLYVRDVDADPAPDLYDARGGNYLNFPLPDGRRLVLEAMMPGPTGRIGLPLVLLDPATQVKDVLLHNDGVKWSILVDGRLDQDFPIAPPFWPLGVAATSSPRVLSASFEPCAEKGAIPELGAPRPIAGSIQFWSPAGHNQWLGDVVLANFDGAVHVFYLVDRRHHNSKGGRGGHWFEHLRSANLSDWEELPPAVRMERREEYIGTGTPLFHEGRYYLAYGLHTRRHVPESETTEPEQAAYLREHGEEGVFRMADLHGVPMGGSYVVSDDAVHFEKSNILFSSDQNPSIYQRDDGLIGLGRSDSLWYSDHLGGWKLWDANTPTFGDCPCPFSWNGWHYIIQGFCTMGVSATGQPGTYEDAVASGDDIYEGLSVPMVVPYGDNRRLYVGWINHIYGWGGWICFRELVQYPDGRLGTKWVPEIPLPDKTADYAVPAGGSLAVRFEADSPDAKTFELRVDGAATRAQFSTVGEDGAAPRIATLSEATAHANPPRERIRLGRKCRPDDGGDFAIGHIRGLDAPFAVRVLQHFDAKSGITLVDVEIAGQRTMVTRRLGRYRRVDP